MSNRQAIGAKRGGKGNNARRFPTLRRKAVVALCLLLSLAATAAVLARRGSLLSAPRSATGPASTPASLEPQSTPTPLNLAKEYIYAGGRLIATEEAAGSPACTGSITPPSQNFSSSSGSGSISVTATPSSCTWTATSNAGWMTITGGGSGTGNGTVSYTVAANTGAGRNGTITISGQGFSQTFTASQAPGTILANDASFISQSVPATMSAGQQVSVSVTMQNTGSATWTAAAGYKLGSQNPQDNTTWGLNRVAVSGSVPQNAQVVFSFTVTAPSTPGTYNFQWRMVQEDVEWFGTPSTNLVITVSAPASCDTLQLNPTTRTHTAPPQTDSVEVTADSACNWAAVPGPGSGWITIVQPGSGTGNGVFNYSLAQNPGPGQRTGTILVAGKTFTVIQNPPCGSYSTLPTSNPNVGEAGVTTSLTVVTGRPDCVWHAVPSDSWIHCDTNGRVGGGSLIYVVDQNLGGARSGKITIFGEGDQLSVDFNINQAGAANSALYIGQNVATSLFPQQGKAVSVTIRNTGTADWEPGQYVLRSQNPAGNSTWGVSDVGVPSTVPKLGGEVTFAFTITAPFQEAVYNFQWQMYKLNAPSAGFFGPLTPNVQITVSGTAGVPPPTNLTANASPTSVTLTWQNNITQNITYIERKLGSGAWGQIAAVGGTPTSYLDQSLPPGTYTYRVRVMWGNGDLSAYSEEAVAVVTGNTPSDPTNLVLSLPSGLTVVLTWTDTSSVESGFKVYRKTSTTTYTLIATLGPNTQSHTDTSVQPTTGYTYKVTAVNGTLESGPTNEAQITTGTAPPADPSDLTANAIASNQVDLQWLDNSNNEDGFKIERKTGAGPFVEIQTVAAGSTSFSDTTTVAFTTYRYRVKAFSASGGSSNPTNEVEVTTPGTITAPSNLTATASSSTQINLTWVDNSNNEQGFKIERKTGGGNFVEIGSVAVNAMAYSDTGLTASTPYTYRVRGFAGISFSPYSNEASATTPVGGPSCSTVSTLSGNGGYGYLEGSGTSAQWRRPVGGFVAKDPQTGLSALFVADTENHRIRKVMLEGGSTGQSSLLAGDGTAGYNDAPTKVRYNYPRGISGITDASGVVTTLVIADTNNHAIRKLTWTGSGWSSALLSGSTTGSAGSVNGSATASRFNSPQALVAAPDGFIYVADTVNKVIRKLTQTGTSSTLATAGFLNPVGITASGTAGAPLYVSDSSTHQIFQVTTSGSVLAIAGSGVAGFADGTAGAASFNTPGQLVWANPTGGALLFIADQNNHRIRRMLLSNNAVTTHAGSGAAGSADGSCGVAQFNGPRGIAYFPTPGAVYVIDTINNRVRKLQ